MNDSNARYRCIGVIGNWLRDSQLSSSSLLPSKGYDPEPFRPSQGSKGYLLARGARPQVTGHPPSRFTSQAQGEGVHFLSSHFKENFALLQAVGRFGATHILYFFVVFQFLRYRLTLRHSDECPSKQDVPIYRRELGLRINV